MTKPATGQVGPVLSDEVARRLGLRAEAVCYGRRGLRGLVSGPPGRRGPGRIGKAARWCRASSDHRNRPGRG
jgi:hypothetical protein